jgi:hypothetical protein
LLAPGDGAATDVTARHAGGVDSAIPVVPDVGKQAVADAKLEIVKTRDVR